MLKTRIVTAVLLFSIFFSALFYLPPLAWVVFSTLIASVAAWEWGALMRISGNSRIAVGSGFFCICFVIGVTEPAALGLESGFYEAAWRLGRWAYLPSAAFWMIVVPCWMNANWPLKKPVPGLITGLFVLLPTWLALIQLRQAGALVLLAIMASIWLADIAAYFFGRTFGKHKLAPGISPGKTWEGALGGAFSVIVYGFVLLPYLPDFLSGNYAMLLLVLVLLAAVSVIGDLFESLLKRQAGLKDSSNILPGHGGVLDRIDSLTSTLPMVALIWLLALN